MKYPELEYTKAEASFWTAEEIDLTYDYRDWITPKERATLYHALFWRFR